MARGDRNGNAATVNRPGRPRKANARVAAATKIKLDDRRTAQRQAAKRQEWQDEAWDYFDDVPEIKYATWFSGNALSKLRIFAAFIPDDPTAAPIPLNDPQSGASPELAARAQAELDRLRGPLGGQPEILRSLNMNLEIAAECYLVGYGPREVRIAPDDPLDLSTVMVPEEWAIKSVSEVDVKDGVYTIKDSPNDQNGRKLDPELDTIIRIWQRHPRFSKLPDCNMRGVLSDCEALLLLSNQVKAEAKSRQSAGAFTLPNELSFGSPDVDDDVQSPDDDGDDAESDDEFEQELMVALTDPIEDPSSAAAVMPMVIRGPAEFLKPDVLRHISFSRDTTAVLEERIAARINRIARGLNMPVEVIMGHMATTFANAAQVDEDTFEDHLEPRCVLVVDALSVGFLRPQLVDAGVDELEAERICVWYDPAGLIGKVDPKDSASEGIDRGLIKESSWRRVYGWDEDDAPDPLELLIRAGLRRGILTADLTKALLDLLGETIDVVPLPQPPPADGTAGGAGGAAAIADLLATATLLRARQLDAPDVAEPDRNAAGSDTGGLLALPAAASSGTPPGRRLMDIDRDLRARVQVAADRAVTRAVERAGSRLKSKAGATRSTLRSVAPMYAAATLGPSLVAAAGFTDDELIGDDAWTALQAQYMQWGAKAQGDALKIAGKLAKWDDKKRAHLAARQGVDLVESWAWMHDALTKLAHRLLYAPDGTITAAGEVDPTSRVPTGLVRQGIARAGGVDGLEIVGPDEMYVAVKNGGAPIGGIGTGDLLGQAMAADGVSTEGYEWVYGPAFRAHPFEEHLALDGEVFAGFDDDVLSKSTANSWLPTTSYFPGDHPGCACDLVPVLVGPDDRQAGVVLPLGGSDDATADSILDGLLHSDLATDLARANPATAQAIARRITGDVVTEAEQAELVRAVGDAPAADIDLSRGVGVDVATRDAYIDAATLEFEADGFTTGSGEFSQAVTWATSNPGEPVVFTVEAGSGHAFDTSTYFNLGESSEDEWLVSGTFNVLNTETIDGVLYVRLGE